MYYSNYSSSSFLSDNKPDHWIILLSVQSGGLPSCLPSTHGPG